MLELPTVYIFLKQVSQNFFVDDMYDTGRKVMLPKVSKPVKFNFYLIFMFLNDGHLKVYNDKMEAKRVEFCPRHFNVSL